MVLQNKKEMLGIEGGGFITGFRIAASIFKKIIYRSIFRW